MGMVLANYLSFLYNYKATYHVINFKDYVQKTLSLIANGGVNRTNGTHF